VGFPVVGLYRFREKFFDRARSLADALFVFDERNADEALAMLAKSHSGRDGEVSLFDQKLRKPD
jgi:hypothetical protein